MIIAANWKMHLHQADAKALIATINSEQKSFPDPLVVVCPPSLYLHQVRQWANSSISVGAQNCHEQASGAFTGEISASMAADCGASHVIIGHSERRAQYLEAGAQLADKLQQAEEAGLVPIYCVGETLAERQSGQQDQIITQQIADIAAIASDRLIIAYEPVWAIGTGQVASVPDIVDMHKVIKTACQRLTGQKTAPAVLYGGSVKPENAEAILSAENVDGALIGGASLQAQSFCAICEAAQDILNA